MYPHILLKQLITIAFTLIYNLDGFVILLINEEPKMNNFYNVLNRQHYTWLPILVHLAAELCVLRTSGNF